MTDVDGGMVVYSVSVYVFHMVSQSGMRNWGGATTFIYNI